MQVKKDATSTNRRASNPPTRCAWCWIDACYVCSNFSNSFSLTSITDGRAQSRHKPLKPPARLHDPYGHYRGGRIHGWSAPATLICKGGGARGLPHSCDRDAVGPPDSYAHTVRRGLRERS